MKKNRTNSTKPICRVLLFLLIFQARSAIGTNFGPLLQSRPEAFFKGSTWLQPDFFMTLARGSSNTTSGPNMRAPPSPILLGRPF